MTSTFGGSVSLTTLGAKTWSFLTSSMTDHRSANTLMGYHQARELLRADMDNLRATSSTVAVQYAAG